MELCFVYDCVHPWETGGIQKRVWELARRLAGDHDVHWYGLHYWDGPPVIDREGVTLHGVMAPTELYVDGRRSIAEALSFAARLGPAIVGEGFDVIDCQAFPYFPAFPSKLAAAVGHATLAVTWHEVWGDYWYEYLGRKGAFGKAVERLTARLADVHLAVSELTGRDVRGLGVESVRISPNGIDPEAIDAVAPAEGGADVLFVGRLIAEKNPALLVRAVDRLRDGVTCAIVGEGPEEAGLRSLIEERGLTDAVELPGFLESHDDVLARMKAADVLVLPSRREGFGITALEALACGTPVVTIEHPRNAATELVEDGLTGFVVAPTAGALADAISRARREIDPADCRECAGAYDWSRIADDLEEIYREVR